MRIFSTMAAAVCLSYLAAIGSVAAMPTDTDGAPAGASAASKPSAMTPAAASADAAAKKHAKRTACLKNAKSKKLVGADKSAFLKNCIAAP